MNLANSQSRSAVIGGRCLQSLETNQRHGMPHPRLSLRSGPSHLQSALLLGRSSNNRLVIGGVLQLESSVTMISDTLTSLSSETGMYVYSNARDANNIVIAYRHACLFPSFYFSDLVQMAS